MKAYLLSSYEEKTFVVIPTIGIDFIYGSITIIWLFWQITFELTD